MITRHVKHCADHDQKAQKNFYQTKYKLASDSVLQTSFFVVIRKQFFTHNNLSRDFQGWTEQILNSDKLVCQSKEIGGKVE
jgi:hypothetical protein